MKVLAEDIESSTKDLDVQRVGISSGTRDAAIFELCDLLKRVNSARENGYAVQDDYSPSLIVFI